MHILFNTAIFLLTLTTYDSFHFPPIVFSTTHLISLSFSVVFGKIGWTKWVGMLHKHMTISVSTCMKSAYVLISHHNVSRVHNNQATIQQFSLLESHSPTWCTKSIFIWYKNIYVTQCNVMQRNNTTWSRYKICESTTLAKNKASTYAGISFVFVYLTCMLLCSLVLYADLVTVLWDLTHISIWNVWNERNW